MNETTQCSARVSSGDRWVGRRSCGKTAKVQVDGAWYCAVHDPARVQARRADREAAFRAVRDANAKRKDDADGRVKAVGFGQPHYDWSKGEWTGGVVLTAEDADAIIAALKMKT